MTNKKNRRKCARDIQNLWKKKNGQEISVSTIRHAFNSVGLKNDNAPPHRSKIAIEFREEKSL